MNPQITALFDEATNTVTYIIADPTTRRAAVIDSVLDFDPKSGRTSTRSADRVIETVRRQKLEIEWILETHVHADHLSAAPYIKEKLGGRTGIGAHIGDVQKIFKRVFNPEPTASGNQSGWCRPNSAQTRTAPSGLNLDCSLCGRGMPGTSRRVFVVHADACCCDLKNRSPPYGSVR